MTSFLSSWSPNQRHTRQPCLTPTLLSLPGFNVLLLSGMESRLFPVMSSRCLVTLKGPFARRGFSQRLPKLARAEARLLAVGGGGHGWVVGGVIYINISVNELMGKEEVKLPLMRLLLWFRRRSEWGTPPKQKMIIMIQL